MLIDGFTVAAQVVNFVVLVWLLKRFLYAPILQAIDTREADIAKRISDAAEQQATAQKEQTAYAAKAAALDAERDALMRAATEAAAAERSKLLANVKAEAEQLRQQQQQHLHAEAQAIQQHLCLQTQQTVFAIARKIMANLAGSRLEQQIIQVFVEQLANLAPNAKTDLLNALNTPNATATLKSAFELAPAEQAALTQALSQFFGYTGKLHFEITPALIAGIELSAGSQRVTWHVHDYLTHIEAANLSASSTALASQ